MNGEWFFFVSGRKLNICAGCGGLWQSHLYNAGAHYFVICLLRRRLFVFRVGSIAHISARLSVQYR